MSFKFELFLVYRWTLLLFVFHVVRFWGLVILCLGFFLEVYSLPVYSLPVLL